MLVFLEHFGVTVSALSGVLAAKDKHVDLFGVIVLALVTALGGGTIRDVVLGAGPAFWIHEPAFVLNGVATAVLSFFLARPRAISPQLLGIADAVGLAMFTIIGAAKALDHHTGGVSAVVLGVITGVAGGISRDILVGQIPLVFRQEIYLYATAAVSGGSLFVLLEAWHPGQSINRLAGVGLTLLLRLAAIQWRLSLPVFKG